jgi:hypothetical protein
LEDVMNLLAGLVAVAIALQVLTLTQGRTIMALIDDMRAEVATIKTTLSELAADVDDLLTRIGEPGTTITQADVDDLKSVAASLRATADKHTPPPSA